MILLQSKIEFTEKKLLDRMQFMYSGDAMEARILQDILLGELGQITQSRYTYVLETDLDIPVAKPQLTYIPEESVTPEQFQNIITELHQQYDYNDTGFQWSEAAEIVAHVLLSLADIAATSQGFIGLSIPTFVMDTSCHMMTSTLRAQFCKTEHAALQMDSNEIVLQATWDDTRKKYMFYLDPNILADFNDQRVSFSFVSPFENSNSLMLTTFDPNLDVLDEKYVILSNVDPNSDINGDSITNFKDFAILANHYYEFGSYTDRRQGADLNRDEYIDHEDLFILAQNWLWQAQL